jgi:predicted nuclease of predicted toxin-antitoxin system
VKLLFDANISHRIVRMLDDLFPESTHIAFVGFSGETADQAIWQFAKEQDFAIATADSDFVRLAETRGAPPKIIRLERMDCSTEVAAALVRRYAVAITEFGKSTKPILLLRRN